ncbi:hypothetical protein PGRAN_15882 [Listeria grandensis FSL F6-0971]|uniref:Cyclic nucleotide-binding domain-containing protein n=1 Tax=Listeria grandensis FSL F6-0971 TaxID=1265819 RepID=W7B5Y3_9LIST|nr:Crp/Fnr family transcriptional regulator [Listeria grandensis]EUJ18236.1 hypothetical protein PGRAN_15882 [Listeria grandensis FSL F6-0971]
MQANGIELCFLKNQEALEQKFSTDQLLRFLKDNTIFSNRSKTITLKKKDILIKEGEELKYIYIVKNGTILKSSHQNNTVDFIFSKDIIGLTKFLFNSKSEQTLQVVSDELVVERFHKADVIEKIINTEDGYFYHYLHMQKQLERQRAKEMLLRLPAELRVSKALLLLGSHYDRALEQENILTIAKIITRKMLAHYTNLTQNTVTAILQDLVKKELIMTKQHSAHVYPKKLQNHIKSLEL